MLEEIKLTKQDYKILKESATTEILEKLLKLIDCLIYYHKLKVYSLNIGKEEKEIIKNQYIIEGRVNILNEFKSFLNSLKKKEGDENEKEI